MNFTTKTSKSNHVEGLSPLFPIRWVSETTSTNSSVLKIAQQENLSYIVLASDYQTEGRGQFGRQWLSSPKDNLLFSIYFKPQIKPADASELTQIACRAVVEVLETYKLSCSIKLPNDILVNNKKICGILTESSSRGDKLEYVVVGIGLNVNSKADKLIPEATSMQIELKEPLERENILIEIIKSFKMKVSSHFSVEFDRLVEG